MSEGKPEKHGELYTWRKKIEMIGIDIKSQANNRRDMMKRLGIAIFWLIP